MVAVRVGSGSLVGSPDRFLSELRSVGVGVDDVWDLVNSPLPHAAAIPVLLDWLEHVDERVASYDRPKFIEALARALTIRAARPVAAPALIRAFKEADEGSAPLLRWALGNALSVVGDDSFFDDLAALALDRNYGIARQMVVLGFARSKDRRAVPLLVSLLDDDDVVLHATEALGKLKATEARSQLEALVIHPRPAVRKAAYKALGKLT